MKPLLLALLLAAPLHAQTPIAITIPPNPTSQQLAAVLDPIVDAQTASDAISGVVLVARGNDIVYERATGLASRRYKVPNRTSTRFNIASVGKQFTRAAIGQLAQEGRLNIADPLIKYLPDYPNKAVAEKITLLQLLHHKSGLVSTFGEEFQAASPLRFTNAKAWIDLLHDDALLFEPGADQPYSNYGYILLGEVIARVSGKSYEEYIAENIFKRAGMTDSAFHRSDAIEYELAVGHTRGGMRRTHDLREATLGAPVQGSAAGGSYATARDLFRFTRALRENRLLRPEWTGWFFSDGVAPVDDGSSAARQVTVAAGGSQGANAAIASEGTWTVVVVSNVDPPGAEDLAPSILMALTGQRMQRRR